MVFDTTYQTIGYSFAPDPNNEHGLIVTMMVGTPLPISPGPGQPPVLLPIGQINFPMLKVDGENMVIAMSELIETLPDMPKQSDLVIAGQMPEVDINAIERKLKGIR